MERWTLNSNFSSGILSLAKRSIDKRLSDSKPYLHTARHFELVSAVRGLAVSIGYQGLYSRQQRYLFHHLYLQGIFWSVKSNSALNLLLTCKPHQLPSQPRMKVQTRNLLVVLVWSVRLLWKNQRRDNVTWNTASNMQELRHLVCCDVLQWIGKIYPVITCSYCFMPSKHEARFRYGDKMNWFKMIKLAI